MDHDNELLRRFADEGAQGAFAELVRRKVDLVFAAALRQTGGDAHLAQDVTQGVFVALAGRASSLARHTVLTGWLFSTTRFLAISAVRRQRRWQRREQEANAMTFSADQSDPAWQQLRPVIDEALHELDARDRDALLLRFFEGRSLADVGAAINLTENSARMRVERALEKLRARLVRRGITSTVAALGIALVNQPTVAAPPGLVAAIAGASLASAATGPGFAALLFSFMNTIKTFAVATVVLLAFLAGKYFEDAHHPAAVSAAPVLATPEQNRLIAGLREDNATLKDAVGRLEAERATAVVETTQAQARISLLEAQLRAAQGMFDKVTRSTKQKEMLNNLRRIEAARDQHILEHGRVPTFAELVGPDTYLKELKSADGEDYSNIDLSNKCVLSVVSPNGIALNYYIGPVGDLREPWGKALRAYQDANHVDGPAPNDLRALAAYFENPKYAADYVGWLNAQSPGR